MLASFETCLLETCDEDGNEAGRTGKCCTEASHTEVGRTEAGSSKVGHTEKELNEARRNFSNFINATANNCLIDWEGCGSYNWYGFINSIPFIILSIGSFILATSTKAYSSPKISTSILNIVLRCKPRLLSSIVLILILYAHILNCMEETTYRLSLLLLDVIKLLLFFLIWYPEMKLQCHVRPDFSSNPSVQTRKVTPGGPSQTKKPPIFFSEKQLNFNLNSELIKFRVISTLFNNAVEGKRFRFVNMCSLKYLFKSTSSSGIRDTTELCSDPHAIRPITSECRIVKTSKPWSRGHSSSCSRRPCRRLWSLVPLVIMATLVGEVATLPAVIRIGQYGQIVNFSEVQ